jgi:hypothetical protein
MRSDLPSRQAQGARGAWGGRGANMILRTSHSGIEESRGALGRRVSLLLLTALLAVFALGACGSGGQNAIPWEGSWREIGTPEHYVLQITPGGTYDTAAEDYAIEYPRSFLVPFSAFVKDGKLLIWGENTQDVVWTVTYDRAADKLTAVGSQGTFDLQRIEK